MKRAYTLTEVIITILVAVFVALFIRLLWAGGSFLLAMAQARI